MSLVLSDENAKYLNLAIRNYSISNLSSLFTVNHYYKLYHSFKSIQLSKSKFYKKKIYYKKGLIIRNKMFKKRGIQNQSSNPTNSQQSKPNATTGIDLRKDIEQMQGLIVAKSIPENKSLNQAQVSQPNDGQSEAQQSSSVFKTKKINKFTSHIMKNLPTHKLLSQQSNNNEHKNQKIQQKSQQGGNKISNGSQAPQFNQIVRPYMGNYGLMDKNNFKSNDSRDVEVIQGKGKNHEETLMDYYIKKKMEELNKNTTNASTVASSYTNPQRPAHKPTSAWQEVLQIQNQYLTQQEKIKSYSIEEIQKRLQKLAQQTIRTEIEKRNSYLKDLLQNQHQRMQYASKKQLKMMRQEKQRIERQINSKYNDTGRRGYIQTIKKQTL